MHWEYKTYQNTLVRKPQIFFLKKEMGERPLFGKRENLKDKIQI